MRIKLINADSYQHKSAVSACISVNVSNSEHEYYKRRVG
jgi:hypothetical protein